MKPRTDSQQPAQHGSEVVGPARGAQPQVSDEHEQLVVGFLSAACDGLTLNQIRARTGGSVPDPESVLARLVERRIVSRLNTLIPTYAVRARDGKADAQ